MTFILPKLANGQRPSAIDLIKNKDIAIVINTSPAAKTRAKNKIKVSIAAMQYRIPIMTTLRSAGSVPSHCNGAKCRSIIGR